MKVIVHADNSIGLPVAQLCAVLNAHCDVTDFHPGQTPTHIRSDVLDPGKLESYIADDLATETRGFDLSFIATNVPYDNNYFFATAGDRVIVSFAGWNNLTGLPLSNGLAYFIADVLLERVGPVPSHDGTTGCVSDFLWDKRGVDAGMRAAYICQECRRALPDSPGAKAQIADVEAILDALCRASRANSDIVALAPEGAPADEAGQFDAFLCHNSEDKPAVRSIDRALRDAGLKPWLDEIELEPGLPWIVALEQEIERVRRALVFVGPNGSGPWQEVEIRALLGELVERQCPVIPILLPGAPEIPQLPLFLRQMTWIDLRESYDERLAFLIDVLRRPVPRPRSG